MSDRAPLFYVTLRESEDTGDDAGQASLFADVPDVRAEARRRLTPGRVYPVVDVVREGQDLVLPDDDGRLFTASSRLFRFVRSDDSPS